MSFFSRLFVFGSGLVSGIYLDQKYSLPDVERKLHQYYHFIKMYEPPKKHKDDNSD